MAGNRTDLEALVYQVSADIKGLERTLERGGTLTDRYARAQQARFDKVAAAAGAHFSRISTVAGVAFGGLIAYSVKAASDANELQDAFGRAFDAGTEGAKVYAKTLAKEVGRSNLEVQESMMRLRLLLKKQDADVADSLSKTLTKRSIDIGSMYNVADADALQAIFSGISGESEPLKRFGVTVNETAVKLELMKLGFKGNAEQAPETAKQIARANIILRETAIVANNARDTLGSTANQAKKVQGEFRDTAAAFGTQFLPVANKVLEWAGKTLQAFNDLEPGAQTAGLAMLGLVAAGGPIMGLIKGLQDVIKFAIAARAALIAAGLGGVISGAAVAAPVVAAAGILAVGIAGRPAHYQRASKDPRLASKEDLEGGIDWAERSLARKANGADTDGIKKVRANLAALKAERERRKANPTALSPESLAAIADGPAGVPGAADLSGFGLKGDQKSPIAGGSGSGGKGSGKTPAEIKADQDARFAEALARAQQDELDTILNAARGIDERADLELQRVDAAGAARDEELKQLVASGDLTKTQADALALAEGRVRKIERENIEADRREALEEQLYQHQLALSDEYGRMATIAIGMARTLGERYRLERAELDRRHKDERDALDRDLDRRNAPLPQRREEQRAQEARQDAEISEYNESIIGQYKTGLAEAFQAIEDGNFVERFVGKLKAQLLDAFADLAARQIFAADAGGGNLISKGFNLLTGGGFAGRKAAGGMIPAGQWGIINDGGGSEPIRWTPNGIEVAPHRSLRPIGAPGTAGMRSSVIHQHFDVNAAGSILAEGLVNDLQRVGAETAGVRQGLGALAQGVGQMDRSLAARFREQDSLWG